MEKLINSLHVIGLGSTLHCYLPFSPSSLAEFWHDLKDLSPWTI